MMIVFNNFSLGQNAPSNSSKKTFKTPLRLEEAISAVSGNALKKFIVRLKLAMFHKGEWFNEKNIKARIHSHSLDELKNLNKLFQKLHPSSEKTDKRSPQAVHFMASFVVPSLYTKVREKFLQDLPSEDQLFFKEAAAENLLVLLEKNLTAQDLVHMTKSTPSIQTLLADPKGSINPLFEKILGSELRELVNEFVGNFDETLREGLYCKMPENAQKLLKTLVGDEITAEMILTPKENSIGSTATDLIGFLEKNADLYHQICFFSLDRTDLIIPLMKLPMQSSIRLLLPILGRDNIKVRDFTGLENPSIEDVINNADNLTKQKEVVMKILIYEADCDDEDDVKTALNRFFARSFVKEQNDLGYAIEILQAMQNNSIETRNLIVRLGKLDLDLEEIKETLNGNHLLKRMEELAPSKA